MKDANHWSHLFKYIITSALVAASKYALSKEIKLRNKEMSYSFFKIWEVQRQVRENKPNSNRGSSREGGSGEVGEHSCFPPTCMCA